MWKLVACCLAVGIAACGSNDSYPDHWDPLPGEAPVARPPTTPPQPGTPTTEDQSTPVCPTDAPIGQPCEGDRRCPMRFHGDCTSPCSLPCTFVGLRPDAPRDLGGPILYDAVCRNGSWEMELRPGSSSGCISLAYAICACPTPPSIPDPVAATTSADSGVPTDGGFEDATAVLP